MPGRPAARATAAAKSEKVRMRVVTIVAPAVSPGLPQGFLECFQGLQVDETPLTNSDCAPAVPLLTQAPARRSDGSPAARSRAAAFPDTPDSMPSDSHSRPPLPSSA
ncbi:hypothetical protein Maq22A_c07115 [Methylobacterium aquaticum]|uniref:Uncharacterized protein n=1 Tax=Methylobacterium aquaticum TaxID=270351 RepID=A0A0C6FI74_9HYPH|nr:hypothetical protein Maq22A_c07115 [Methylobacterium aquaticum]